MPPYDDEYDESSWAAERAVAAARLSERQSWVDLQVRQAVERGELGHLPSGAQERDPDWWVARLAQRERDAVLPPSLALLKEDAGLDELLDHLDGEQDVRRVVVDFNERVSRVREQLPDDPSPITVPRDVDATVVAWQERRTVPRSEPGARRTRRHWWNRRTRREGDR